VREKRQRHPSFSIDSLIPLKAGQLLEISTPELRSMSTEALLQKLAELGLNVEEIKNKSQALTRLMENAIGSESLEEE
jgi:hypothetical protein